MEHRLREKQLHSDTYVSNEKAFDRKTRKKRENIFLRNEKWKIEKRNEKRVTLKHEEKCGNVENFEEENKRQKEQMKRHENMQKNVKSSKISHIFGFTRKLVDDLQGLPLLL